MQLGGCGRGGEKGLDPGFASVLELHPSLMDAELDRKEAGRDGTRVFGLAAGRKKLPLIELGKQANGTCIWRGPWGQKSERGFGRVVFEMASDIHVEMPKRLFSV